MTTCSDCFSESTFNPSTLVELLRWRARHQPQRRIYTFLVDGEVEGAHLTYAEVECQARAIGALLQSYKMAGERALLLYPPGLEFIAAFFGCLYGGAIAVPAYPPHPARLDRSLPRLQAIVADAQPGVVLTTSSIVAIAQDLLAQAPDFPALRWLATDDLARDLAEAWRDPLVTRATLAFLQYTSGSTAAPKGVMVSHGNLLHNERMIQRAFQQTEQSLIVGWLPLYHDMGLIGNVLQPLYVGAPCILMSPMAFLQSPFRWLETISRYQATTSGGPNFAYDLCARKITPEQRALLDLRSWRVAFNGSEPIRQETLDRFAATFEPYGFRRAAFSPCYGLAEATLFVSGGVRTAPPHTYTVLGTALEHHWVVTASHEDVGSRTLVSSGPILSEQAIALVDPESLTRCLPEQVGEIWLSGPSVAQGYWQRMEEAKHTFHAYLETGEGPFLRTGDFGFLQDGELFITGRLKDLIIIRGRNHYPQDIERTVEQSHPAIRPGCCAAFSVEVAGAERLVVVAELERHYRLDRRPTPVEPGADPRRHSPLDVQAVAAAARQAVAEQHELQAYAVVLIKTGTIPKTTSGKIQRHACRAAFLAQGLEVVGRSILGNAYTLWGENHLTRQALLTTQADERPARLEAYLREKMAQVLRVDPSQVGSQQPLSTFGLDSIMAIELKNEIESSLGVTLPMASFLQSAHVAQLTAQVLAQLNAPNSTPSPIHKASEESVAEHPLSRGQQALWFLHQLTPENTAYNLVAAVRIRTELDLLALQRTFQALVDRHPSLRTTFTTRNGKPVQRVHKHMEICFEERASTGSLTDLNRHLAAEAYRPFDLEQGPLFRVTVFPLAGGERILLLAVHHIVTDFWSLAVLMRELGVLYAAETEGTPVTLAPLALQYTDYVYWQADMLASPEGDRLRAYWQEQLVGAPPVLSLPTDRPRPLTQTYRGASQVLRIPPDLTRRVRALGQAHGSTLYTILLAAFQVLLYRYTGREDFLVGSPTAGRSRAEWAGLVGYFINPVVLRADLTGNPTFETFLSRVRQTVLAALARQDYPFAQLVEQIQTVRDPSRSPLFQVMFILQKAPLLSEENLASLALGEAGASIRLGGLTLESAALEQPVAQFELTLTLAEVDGGLAAAWQYNTDLFDALTITRMMGHFQTVLEGIVTHPAEYVSRLPLLTKEEANQLLVEWNDTQRAYPRHPCIHQLFEAQVERTPERVAVVFENELLTYRELNRRTNQLAHHLQALGVGPEIRVGICMERSLEMVVGLLGILKAGGAYVPLDPAYPKERLAFMLDDAQASVLVTQKRLVHRLPGHGTPTIYLDSGWKAFGGDSEQNPTRAVTAENLAYVIYTSGSTGKSKGVMISHRNVVNFFSGMDAPVGCGTADTLLAVTSISFDISVLELFWTLVRGARVVLLSDQATRGVTVQPKHVPVDKGMQFSLFYFASDESAAPEAKYRLLLEGARFADQHDFTAVWTPERHFHAFGGLYPNPSVMSAGLATVTERVQIRAGSVVLPLHHPIRVAEEWSLVDNLSKGRVGLAFASGWHADDFVFFPENYTDRKDAMFRMIETVQKLWRGEAITVRGGAGNEIKIKIFPKPVQPELPIWITAAGSPETFAKAGEIGAHVLTHLLGQTVEEIAEKIELYRNTLAKHGHDPRAGHVTLMLHTFLGEDREAVREKVRVPFTNYLKSSVGLIGNLIRSLNLPLDLNTLSAQDMDALLAFAFDRYFETSALFGTPSTCHSMIDRLKAIGVDEVACLIDFGIDAQSVMASLDHLDALRVLSQRPDEASDYSWAAQAVSQSASLMQCTPSMMRMLTLNPDTLSSLQSLRVLLLGGEALPPPLAHQVKDRLPSRIINMYGPTETTIWSATHEVDDAGDTVPIGRPIANTQIYILDRHLQPVPVGLAGELHIGGEGLARGYLRRPDLTAERFIPNPFYGELGARLYKTGDLTRYLPDGTIEFLGRLDQQVKIRGFRIELGEIEAVLGDHPAVRETAVSAWGEMPDDPRLVAYVVYDQTPAPSPRELRAFLEDRLPSYMVPSLFVPLERLPLTANGKVDRRALPPAEGIRPALEAAYVAPTSAVERTIAAVWQEVLKVERVGIHDNFFDLGGHSLLMVQVHSRLQDLFKNDLPLIKILEHPTIGALAKYLSRERSERLSPQRSRDRARKQREGLRRHGEMMRTRDNTRWVTGT